MSDVLVRLKPYNKKRGCVIKRIMIRGVRFDESKGWYRVSRAFADHLETIHQDYYDEDSPLAFDIMSQDDAIKLEEKEKKASEAKAEASAPRAAPAAARPVERAGALTTSDLPGKADAKDDADEDAKEEAPAPTRTSRRRRRS